jgi:hypothetical protein
MEENEWKDNDVKEFTKLIEQSERAWKPAKKKLEIINVGARQDEKEFK